MFDNKENVWIGVGALALILALIIPVFILMPCSSSSLRDMTWELEFMESEQSYNQSILYLTEQIFEWEKMADDFSMHEAWVENKDRATLKLDNLKVSIPALQAAIDQCD